jgi:hypothetical protein
MKITFAMLIAALCLLLGFGCITASGPDPQPSNDEVEQSVTDCAGWEGCYKFCRLRFKCTTPDGCDRLGNCLDGCDASFPTCF